jgi:hypothetical protein
MELSTLYGICVFAGTACFFASIGFLVAALMFAAKDGDERGRR